MAIGWLSILKAVPWTDVVSNAPKVADGAKKLWETVARKKAPTGTSASATSDTSSPAGQEARIAELAGELDRLQQEMLASSQLLKTLAEQNAQLVRRVYWQSRLLLVVGLIAVAGLTLVLLR
ncbi:hypothetical protein [Quatrionicoccus australiensis]|uniref:hypothetical protein n=1 Tax=Quatrionicoccus australiensis TaxID=138118 RepID=UPI001CFA31AB|nr:hypothetical protein [Quatrionicoccus australiensis]MCB4361464.1 hypothetical protein [Quatrionicoccus australiensis]